MDIQQPDSDGELSSPSSEESPVRRSQRVSSPSPRRSVSLYNLQEQSCEGIFMTFDRRSRSRSPPPADDVQPVPVPEPDNQPGPSNMRHSHNGSTFQLRGRPNPMHHIPDFSHYYQRFYTSRLRNGLVGRSVNVVAPGGFQFRPSGADPHRYSLEHGMRPSLRPDGQPSTLRERQQEYERRREESHERRHWQERRRGRERARSQNPDRSRSPSENSENYYHLNNHFG